MHNQTDHVDAPETEGSAGARNLASRVGSGGIVRAGVSPATSTIATTELTAEQLQTLRHMLGIDLPSMKAPRPYRDYYCASKGDQHLNALAELGAVSLYRQCEHYDWYCTTAAGRAAAIASHKRIRKSKGKCLYSRYLDLADAIPDLTFRDFLTRAEFAEARSAA